MKGVVKPPTLGRILQSLNDAHNTETTQDLTWRLILSRQIRSKRKLSGKSNFTQKRLGRFDLLPRVVRPPVPSEKSSIENLANRLKTNQAFDHRILLLEDLGENPNFLWKNQGRLDFPPMGTKSRVKTKANKQTRNALRFQP
jgi:hypothetical protein